MTVPSLAAKLKDSLFTGFHTDRGDWFINVGDIEYSIVPGQGVLIALAEADGKEIRRLFRVDVVELK